MKIKNHDLIRTNLNDILYFTILIIAGFKITFRIENVLDILFNDESLYLEKGINLGLKRESDGILYYCWYKFLSLLTSNNIDLYYLNCSLLMIIPSLLLFLFLRSIKINPLIAFLCSVTLMISYINVYLYPFITKFSLSILLTAFIILNKSNSFGYKLVISVFISFVLSYIRPEYILSFYLFGLTLIIFIIYNIKKFDLKKLFILSLPVIILSLIIFRFNPSNGPRSFIAFAQHYIRDINERNGINNDDISEKLIVELFDQNNSVIKVALNQPALFFEHIIYNIKRLPVHISDMFPYFIPKGKDFFIDNVIYFLTLIFIFCAIIVYFVFQKEKKSNMDFLILSFFIFPTFISILLFYPRSHYMIIMETMIIIFLCKIISKFLEEKKYLFIDSVKTVVIIGILSVVLIPNRFLNNSMHESGCTNLKIIKSLNIIADKQKVNLLTVAAGISPFLNENITYISAKFYNLPYKEFIKKYDINMVLVNESLLNHKNILNNNEFDLFRNDTTFVVKRLNNCDEQLIISKRLLNK